MATLTAIRNGLAVNLATITGLQTSAEQLSNPTPPAAWVTPGDPVVEFDTAMGRGIDKWNLVVEVFVALTSDKGAQRRLDGFIAGSGATSIKAALQSDRTLAGVAHDLRVTRVDGYAEYQLARVAGAGIPVLGFRAHVEVYTSGT